MDLLDLVFPKVCLGCGFSGSYVCPDCVAKVRLAQPMCPYCNRASIDGLTHIKCQEKIDLNGLISIWEYEGVIRKAILALKYKYATEIASLLNKLVVGRLRTSDLRHPIPDSAMLVPVPLHWRRQNVRGFNQSVVIGKSISESMNWKFIPDALVKKRSTVSQTDLSGDARRQNLEDVFALDSGFQIPDSIILFDDVFTTGSTLREAARVLKRAGADKVWGLTIAR